VQLVCSVIPAEPVVSGLRWYYLPERLVTVPAQARVLYPGHSNPGRRICLSICMRQSSMRPTLLSWTLECVSASQMTRST